MPPNINDFMKNPKDFPREISLLESTDTMYPKHVLVEKE